MHEIKKPTENNAVGTKEPEVGGSPTAGLKQSLRGMNYDDQVAALTPVQAKASGAAPVQATTAPTATVSAPTTSGLVWASGINVATPSTYDAGGGHSYKDHGAHTTEAQHRKRLKSGEAPSGRVSPVPGSAPGASKFDSDATHAAALKAVETQLITKNQGKTRKRGLTGKIGVSGAGTIYTRANTAEAATDVFVDVQVANDEFNITTAFPTK